MAQNSIKRGYISRSPKHTIYCFQWNDKWSQCWLFISSFCSNGMSKFTTFFPLSTQLIVLKFSRAEFGSFHSRRKCEQQKLNTKMPRAKVDMPRKCSRSKYLEEIWPNASIPMYLDRTVPIVGEGSTLWNLLQQEPTSERALHSLSNISRYLSLRSSDVVCLIFAHSAYTCGYSYLLYGMETGIQNQLKTTKSSSTVIQRSPRP